MPIPCPTNDCIAPKALIAVLAGLLLAGHVLSSCTSGQHQGSPVYYEGSAKERPRSAATVAKDAMVAARVRAKIFSDDLVSSEGVEITVRHGVVYLEGQTQDHHQGRMLANLIRGIDGVVGVENHLNAVHTGTTFVSENEFISGKIKMRLLEDEELTTMPIRIQANATHVVITGNVMSQAQKQKVSALAKEHSGDRQIINQLTVRH